MGSSPHLAPQPAPQRRANRHQEDDRAAQQHQHQVHHGGHLHLLPGIDTGRPGFADRRLGHDGQYASQQHDEQGDEHNPKTHIVCVLPEFTFLSIVTFGAANP